MEFASLHCLLVGMLYTYSLSRYQGPRLQMFKPVFPVISFALLIAAAYCLFIAACSLCDRWFWICSADYCDPTVTTWSSNSLIPLSTRTHICFIPFFSFLTSSLSAAPSRTST